MLFDAHYHAFVAWDGIPQRGIYDNMKTTVDKVKRGKLRDVNARFKLNIRLVRSRHGWGYPFSDEAPEKCQY